MSKLSAAVKKAKQMNVGIVANNSIPRVAYRIKKKNYKSGYNVEALPVEAILVENSMKLQSDFRSKFLKSYKKKYTAKGYKRWATI